MIFRILALSVCLLLAACGGASVDDGQSPAARTTSSQSLSKLGEPGKPAEAARQRPLGAAAAAPVSDSDIDLLFDWAEWNWKNGFFTSPSASRQQERGGFDVRGREYAGAFLGVTRSGDIYGLGFFSNGVLIELGHISDYASLVAADLCYVRPRSCTVVPPRIRGLSLISNTIAAGMTHSLDVMVDGTPPFTYQWLQNGRPVAGQTGSTLRLNRATPSQSGDYTVTVRNAAGSATSGSSRLTVTQTPALRYFTGTETPYVGEQQAFYAHVVSVSSAPMTYRWYRNGQLVATSTSNAYIIPSLTMAHSGVYAVEVTNQYGTTRSQDIVLSVLQARPAPLPKWRLRGTVSNGKPMASADITVRCSNGTSGVFGRTDSRGGFDFELGAFAVDPAPCLVEARGGEPAVTLRSYARTSGVVNINPLTDLTLLKAFGATAPTLFIRFGTGVPTLTASQKNAIADAAPIVQWMLETISGGKATRYSGGYFPDPFSSDFQLGDDRDRLFRALAATLAAAQTSYTKLQELVIANAALRESFRGKLYDEFVARIEPVASSIRCTPDASLLEVTCIVTGRNLTLPKFNPLFDYEIDSVVGLSVSLITPDRKRSAPTAPWLPAWCTTPFLSSSRSTDSRDPDGPDPLSMFAEELTFNCRNTNGQKIMGGYTAEATVDRGTRVIGEFRQDGPVPGPDHPPTGGTIRIDSASCTNGRLTLTGNGLIAQNSVLSAVASPARPTDYELMANPVDVTFGQVRCSHAPSDSHGLYCLPSVQRALTPMTFSMDLSFPGGDTQSTRYAIVWMQGFKSYNPAEVGVVARVDVPIVCR